VKKTALVLTLSVASAWAGAYDVENAKRINKSCALCHGQLGQGTPSANSPRLAGLTYDYLKKEIEYYISGKRSNMAMVVASSMQQMTEKDIDDISRYLSELDIEHMGYPEVNAHKGDKEAGEETFMDECKSCHGRDGMGKPRKGAPMIAGQHGSYLFMQMERFKKKERYHDNDPEDETFDEFVATDMNNLIAFLTDMGKTRIAKAKQTSSKESVQSELAKILFSKSKGKQPGKYRGTFIVSENGEIILSPQFPGASSIGGIKGEFNVFDNGTVVFYPERTK
jgi:cytochrome c553